MHLHNGVYYSVVKNKWHHKIADKWMRLEKHHPEWGIPDPEGKIYHVFTYMWILAVKSMITNP